MAHLPDRRRINGPGGGTTPSVLSFPNAYPSNTTQQRTRLPGEMRKIFLKTGMVPSVSGSAYLEMSSSPRAGGPTSTSGPKIVCTVLGPRPLPRSAPFSPHLLLSVRVKFAPFASRVKRGHIPDPVERDLAAHVETALRSVMLAERWPKSGLDVSITILEGEIDRATEDGSGLASWSSMCLLASCINAASTAIVEAGVDCVDIVTGGVAAFVTSGNGNQTLVLDPCPSEAARIDALCVVAYLESRDELTETWARSQQDASEVSHYESLVDNAIESAVAARSVLIDALCEGITKPIAVR